MDVEQTPGVVLHKSRRQDAHETRKHHQRRRMSIDLLHQCRIERFAAGKGLVVEYRCSNALLTREHQPLDVGLIADDRRHPGLQAGLPLLLLRAAHDGRHVRARTGNQDDDVLHVAGIIPALPVNPAVSQPRHETGERSC